VAVENINFKGTVFGDYKGYGNEIRGIASFGLYDDWIKILRA
jgi:hypothetical protein